MSLIDGKIGCIMMWAGMMLPVVDAWAPPCTTLVDAFQNARRLHPGVPQTLRKFSGPPSQAFVQRRIDESLPLGMDGCTDTRTHGRRNRMDDEMLGRAMEDFKDCSKRSRYEALVTQVGTAEFFPKRQLQHQIPAGAKRRPGDSLRFWL